MMGLGPRVSCFFLSGLPIMHTTLSSVVFCLDFSPPIFSYIVPLSNVFPLFMIAPYGAHVWGSILQKVNKVNINHKYGNYFFISQKLERNS
jgi:hypothetical protein